MYGTASAQVLFRPSTKSGRLTDYSSPKWPRVYPFINRGTEMVPRRSKGTKKRMPYTCKKSAKKSLKEKK